MVRRLVAIRVPESRAKLVVARLEELGHDALWVDHNDGRTLIEVIVDKGAVGDLLDKIAEHFPGESDLRAVVLEAAATLPVEPEPEPEPEPTPAESPSKTRRLPWKRSKAISREELRNQVESGAEIDDVYLITIVLSAIVAAVGLTRGSSEILVGAMVIAPLLGPNMALALATTLGDGPLFARSIRASAVGFVLTLAVAIVIGAVVGVDTPFNEAIASRTVISLSDLALALASGAAGALALTAGAGMSLVGVMIAVALMPPLVTVGMLLADGSFSAAFGASVLVAANVVCVNLAAVSTFLLRGIRPRAWWEAAVSAKQSRNALTVWVVLLTVVATLIVLRQLAWI
ncbi:MAG: TIGR00341 family protein [Planctomycetota bacterium]|jgi:uncharacterized hydrophobic protein (TIGR00341 family)